MSVLFSIPSEILGAVFLITAAAYIYLKYYVFNFWRKCGVFHLEPTIPIGNVMPLIRAKVSVADYFKEIYDKHKDRPLVGMYMFHRPNLVVNDPNLIRDILAKDFSSFHDRGMFSNEKRDPFTGHLFLLPGKKWRNLRLKLTPTFTSGKIKQMFLTFKETGDSLAKYLDGKAQTREVIEIKDIFARYSTDVIMSTAFGITCNSLDKPNNEFRYWGKKIFKPQPLWNTALLFAPQIFDLFSIPYTDRGVTKFFMKVFRDTVEYRNSKNVTRKDFLNLLMQLMRNGYVEADEGEDYVDNSKAPQKKFTYEEAAAQAYVFFIAGFETSATTACFCVLELAVHQDIQDKVRNEIREVLAKHGDLTYDAIMEMTYLHKVLSETMRKYPSVSILNRVCTKEIHLTNANVTIPEGTLVTIPLYGIQRDPALYPDPEKFDPERFSEENIAARHPYVYLPFGEGPRICIGSRFGLIQTKVGLVSALSKYRIKLAPDVAYPPVLNEGMLFLAPKDGVHVTMEPV